MAFTKIAAAGIGSTGTVTLENVIITGGLQTPSITGAASTAVINSNSLTVSGVSTFAGNIDANGDLDVDGHTELDQLNVSGVSTFVGNVKVGSAVTVYASSGIVSATKYYGDGSSLTGIDATALKDSSGNTVVQANSSGIVVTGVVTATSFSGPIVGSVTGNVIGNVTGNVTGNATGLSGTPSINVSTIEATSLNASGVVTATSFYGDASNLTGIPAGLGTALSQDQSSSLNDIYYTNTILNVTSTITVDPPNSSSIAYTQYQEIAVDEGYDLIVEDGDDLVPDVLGLSTEGIGPLPGAGGRVRADQFTNKAGTGAPTFPNGVVVTGVATTALIVTGDARVTGILTIGTSSVTLDGSNNQINVGTGVTIHHTNGVQVGTNTLHSTGFTVNNINATTATFSGTGAITLSRGTTAERPGSPVNGMLRYNTTLGAAEQYRNNAWVSIDVAPVISGVSPTSYNGIAGTTFTITGSGFQSTDTVKFVTTSGSEYTAGTVGFVGVTTLTATTPQNFTVSDEPLTIKVVTLSGLSVLSSQTIDCGGTPTWNTAAGTISTIYDRYGSYSGITTLSATDPDGQSITYSVTSGSLPAGTSLNSSTGIISGDPTDLEVSTATSNFTVAASDGVNSTSRSFSMVVNAALDGTSSLRAARNGANIKTLNPSATNGTYWINPYTTVAYANPQQYTVDMTNDGWITVDLSAAATNLNNHLSYYSGAGRSVINWNSSIANYLYIASANSGNNSNNWNAVMTDRALLGRGAEFLAWRDWDVSFRLSYSWGWGQITFAPESSFTGTWVDDATTNSGTYGITGTGDAAIFVRNNNSNNSNHVSYVWWNGSGESESLIRSTSGNSDSTTYRFTLIQGVATYYINGSQVSQANLADTGTYSNTGVTSNTKWVWFNQHQSTSWLAISEMKVRNPAT